MERAIRDGGGVFASFVTARPWARRSSGYARQRAQAVVAQRAKITREYVNRLEAGRYDPTVGVLTRIAKALDVGLTELLE